MFKNFSIVIAPFIATLVGFSGSVAVVLAAMQAIGADFLQSSSGISAMCVFIGITTMILSYRYRMPLVTAWSFPASAVLATTQGIEYYAALGAFVFVGVLLCLTALIPWLNRLVQRLPMPIASAMLAGILFRFVEGMFPIIGDAPLLSLGVLLVFFVVRQFFSVYAVLAAILCGVSIAFLQGEIAPIPEINLSRWQWMAPEFDLSIIIGLGVPLYLVTMVSQNLTGFAVLRASGYDDIPARPIVGLTGFASILIAPFGGIPVNLAAITAAICTGKDCHANTDKRWQCGFYYCIFYTLLGLAAGGFVALFAAFPSALIATIAGVALLSPFMSAIEQAMIETSQRWPAIVTFALTASGASFFGLGSPFWGLIAGLSLLGFAKLVNDRP